MQQAMKRLFVLRTNKGGAIIKDSANNPIYFSNKMEAKKARDQRGGDTVVSRGPDNKGA